MIEEEIRSYIRLKSGSKQKQYDELYKRLEPYDGRPYVESMKKALEHYKEYIQKARPDADTISISIYNNLIEIYWGRSMSEGKTVSTTQRYIKEYQVEPFKILDEKDDKEKLKADDRDAYRKMIEKDRAKEAKENKKKVAEMGTEELDNKYLNTVSANDNKMKVYKAIHKGKGIYDLEYLGFLVGERFYLSDKTTFIRNMSIITGTHNDKKYYSAFEENGNKWGRTIQEILSQKQMDEIDKRIESFKELEKKKKERAKQQK